MRLAFWKKKDEQKKKKSIFREWFDAALFAIVAATLIRTFFIEAYTIPTGSMEGSLLVNDYLFVSKVAYGPRVPNTPVAVPLVHNTIFGGESYSKSVQWKYRRFWGVGEVKRNDIVVFNFPNGDTVVKDAPEQDYYALCREMGRENVLNMNSIVVRPVDKKDNYIKRCVAVAGDKLEIRDGVVYINGEKSQVFPHAQSTYLVVTKGLSLSQSFLDEHDIDQPQVYNNQYIYNLPNDKIDLVKQQPQVADVKALNDPAGYVYPNPGAWVFPYDTTNFKWNKDNYGPLVIPKEGATVQLTPQNIAIYRRLIRIYEENNFEERGGKFFIDGKEITSYTFKMNYYWMMGDNRHNSADSRFWGFVPIDHVVGKASFVWLSHENGLRWNRLFRSVKHLSE